MLGFADTFCILKNSSKGFAFFNGPAGKSKLRPTTPGTGNHYGQPVEKIAQLEIPID
jgi:hypothetical protein